MKKNTPTIGLTPLFFGCADDKVIEDFEVHCRRLGYMSAYDRFQESASIRSICYLGL